ncbi:MULTISPECIES: DivIVA domain-containing protein [Microbispora]|uniref:Cell wall synthesis protein Wag31 n=4 Tax=Microbispora TaxID=2005 RepID=A0ABY3LZ56_9ACTN|nr:MULTISPECIES: DivIVA domain-containing protein [Microbispora]RGA00449.1 DivIVA domain-containing protein [Microbispora triticiradicis]TLP55093.1 DivIVA domain-containing protein [Microbispora fusca]TYB59988.1 DivIVA domain-containing protein [Microbispora tritici]GLW21010.1 cell wall synthesis protein Wag31 [Microbispora amethystogenes]
MPLTPADVRNKQFSTTRLRPGYDEEEVDAFLDEVEAELDRLIQENEELRAKLAECLRGKVPGGMGMPGSMQMASAPVAEPKPEMMAPQPEPIKPPEPARPEPVPVGMGLPPAEDNMDTAARVLALAQQTADQAIADARREADETVTRARREADDILGKARRQAEQIIGDARARAETLERDAQERHRQAMGTLVQTRDEIERKVEDLRIIEREYRSRLKLFLEDQLNKLNVSAEGSGPFPILGGGPAMAHAAAPGPQQVTGAPNPFAQEPPQHSGAFPGPDGPHNDRR